METAARRWHAATLGVVTFALALQTVLVVTGSAVLAETDPQSLPVRLGRLVSYFTIQSNLLALLAVLPLAREASYDGPRWRVVRVAGLVGISVTALVHFVLLRPLLELDGADWVADKLLHMVVPAMAVLGWALFGPRPRVTWRVVATSMLWPLAWLAWTLAVGRLTGWVPYPFLDADAEGWTHVLVACAGITALLLALLALARWLDGVLSPTPE